MLRYCAGDLLAFQELYRRHSAALYRFIAWRSPRVEWVDEIMQDSWTALHFARDRYKVEARFRSYLYQIARHRLLDLIAQHQLVLASDLGCDADGVAIFEHMADLADGAQELLTPEQSVQRRQENGDLHAAIAALPSVQKEALVLQQFNHLSVEEIAQVSEVSVETVKSRLRYAMQKLRQHFAKNLATPEELA
ncbi:MAG: sigma-70 family RNA polymerase sigma factor [Undibacterium sp.]|nr:sigma-70 family RNA polymerase sigma factor [Undibacterium sp.]